MILFQLMIHSHRKLIGPAVVGVVNLKPGGVQAVADVCVIRIRELLQHGRNFRIDPKPSRIILDDIEGIYQPATRGYPLKQARFC